MPQQRTEHLELQSGVLLRSILRAGSWLLLAVESTCLLLQGSDCRQFRASTRITLQHFFGEISSAKKAGAEPPVAFVRNFLAAHNSIRAQLKLPPLAWSDKQAQSAQAWANTLIATGKFSIHGPGQNLAEGKPAGSLTERDVVSLWAAEAQYYNPATNTCSTRCGHYTQIVWRGTTTVGCGVARNRTREVWVCDYEPPGNILGERPY
jgi:uncharacterized protein YkwD